MTEEENEIKAENLSTSGSFLFQWQQSWLGLTTAFFAVSTFVYILWQFFQWGGETYRNFINDGAQAITTTAAFFVTWRVACHPALEKQTRRAWRIATIAYFSFACGQTLWFYYRQFEGIEPFPSPVDLAYLSFYPLMLFALISFPTLRQTQTDKRKFILDTATVMIAGATVVWYFIILPTLEKNTDVLKRILNVAFIVGDMVLFLGIITILLRRPPENVRRILFIIVAGLLNLFVADISFAYITLHDIENSGPLVSFWVTGPFLLLLASFYQYQIASKNNGKEAARKNSIDIPTFSWLPYLAVAVGYGVLLLSTKDYWDKPFSGVIFASVILTGIVLLRQLTAVKENIRLHSEQTVKQSELRFRTLIENSSDIVMIFNSQGEIVYQSPSVERILGYEQNSIIGRAGFSFVHPEDLSKMKEAAYFLAQNPHSEVMRECRFQHKDGSWRILEGIAKIIDDKETNTRGVLLNARDINERKVLESKLKHQAFHDPLTNLANRVLFRSRVEEALSQTRSNKAQIAVLFLDLDDFKNVNDTLGHDAGDRLLIEFTDRLRLCIRTKDTIARLGGDEFAVLIEGEDLEKKARSIANRILEKLQESFQIGNSSVNIGISIGIAFSESATRMSADDLLRNADVAMYIAKGEGKNRFVFFENEMHRTLLAQIELENDLRQAIEIEQLTLNYQPIVRLETGQITGMEALARWHHPTKGFIPPLDFIPIAEQTGLIIPLGNWLMREACRQSKKLFDEYGNELTVTINISGKQIQHPDFVDDVSKVLHETQIKPENLILELTESIMMENTEAILKLLQQIKSLGIRLAIDDFGTGYSSLSYLQQFPIDILKIDRSFVDGIENSSQKNAVARTIISLSDTLELATIAEGIETTEQNEILQDLGCEFGQGYFFAKPMSIEQFETELIANYAQYSIVHPSENLPALISKSLN